MKIQKKAISIVEAMVVVVILALGLVGVFSIYNRSIVFLEGVETKIQAIQIAREGIEAVTNIRDTNFLMFPSNTEDCWNITDYDADCINGGGDKLGSSPNFNDNLIVYMDSDYKWRLEQQSDKKDRIIKKDSEGFYTQKTGTDIFPKFYRTISINLGVDLKNVNKSGMNDTASNSGMVVTSTVTWRDRSTTNERKIELSKVLTKYK